MELKEWLFNKYLDWQRTNGKITVKDWAVELGIGYTYLNAMINGNRDNVSMQIGYQIGERLNDFSILAILGYPVPDFPMVGFSEEERSEIFDWLQSVKEALAGLSPVERAEKLKTIISSDASTNTEID